MQNKLIWALIIFLLISISTEATPAYLMQSYFMDATSDIPQNNFVTHSARSFETKVYSLDMLYKSQQNHQIYNGLDIEFLYKRAAKIIDPDRKNKFGLIIDLSKKKHASLEIYNDKAYLDYFRQVERDDILSYMAQLKSNNGKNLPAFIAESSVYFNNPEFYCAYADFLVQRPKEKDLDEAINYYLLGGDFSKASKFLDKSNAYSDKQKIYVLLKAGNYNQAIDLFFRSDIADYEYLSSICAPVYKDKTLDRATKEAIFGHLPETNARQLLDFYSEQGQDLIGYLFAGYRFKADSSLLGVWKQKAESRRQAYLENPSEENIALLIQAGMFAEAYDLHVKNKDYVRAIDLLDSHPAYPYADTVNVLTKAAEQIASGSPSRAELNRIISLYARAQNWLKAGYYSALINDNQQAIAFYEKSSDRDNAEMSRLYASIGNYARAADYKILADSTAYSDIAQLYESGKIYTQAAKYYAKAKRYNIAATCAELTEPRDLVLLADVYLAAGYNQKLLLVLDEMFQTNRVLAGEYYIKTNNIEIYRTKLKDSGNHKEALDTYDLKANYTNAEIDQLIELAKKAGDREKEIIFTNAKLATLSESIENMTIENLNDAIKLSESIGNKTQKQKFTNFLIQYKDRVYGTYYGSQPSFNMKNQYGGDIEIFGEYIPLPASDYIITINKNKSMKVTQKVEAYYTNTIYGNTTYTPPKTYSFSGTYTILRDDDEEFEIKYKGISPEGKLNIIITVNKSDLAGWCKSSTGDYNFPELYISQNK